MASSFHHPCLLVFYLHLFFPGEPQFPRPFPEGVPDEGSVFLLLVPLLELDGVP